MALIDQHITDRYALYNGDCCDVVANMPDRSVDMSVYSPPFCGLYNYSSDERDMSNNATYEGFFEHYDYLVRHMARVTKPGRMNVVHCMDIPNQGQRTGYFDLPGKLVQMHERHGFFFFGRVVIWKEPLRVAIRTRLKHLTHKQLVKDSCQSTIAAGDFILIFKRHGDNEVPVSHEEGLMEYWGAKEVPAEALAFRGHTVQAENRYSQWVWRRYASCVWDDIRIDNVLKYKDAKEPDDEKHVHPLQLDVIKRAAVMWSNPGETVMTPFMGVGSEVYGAVETGRRGVGVELKPSYYKQAIKNIKTAGVAKPEEAGLFDDVEAA
ncbi:MAG TPA: DNA methyltransferase [Terrimesophilobacter sp.]|nr:DNA methyltransferase [Terrimesophilobacter sp.]